MQFFINLWVAETSKVFNVRFQTESVNRMRRISSLLPKWRYPFLHYFHSSHLDYYERLVEFEKNEVDLNCNYVYFPLQLQPEMTTSTFGGGYSDQLLAIEQISRLVPKEHFIYVKENPKQTGRMRGSNFFNRLFRIPNVRILPSYSNTYELIDKSQFVATITGTVGWESICRGKNVLVFGICWYRSLTGVFEFDENTRFDEVRDHKIDHSKLERQVGQLFARSHQGDVFDISGKFRKILRNDNDFQSEVESIAKIILDLLCERIPYTFVSN